MISMIRILPIALRINFSPQDIATMKSTKRKRKGEEESKTMTFSALKKY